MMLFPARPGNGLQSNAWTHVAMRRIRILTFQMIWLAETGLPL